MKALMILKDIKINKDGLGLELHPNCVNDDIEQAILEIESIKKENTRLKKQLSKCHIECGCSFCKPVYEKVLQEFTFTSCDDCKNKIDGTYQEICSNCKTFYGCYFKKKDL